MLSSDWATKMNNKKQQILAFLMGLFTILILLEAGLRIVSYGYQNSRVVLDWSVIHKQKNSFVMLCLGNSYTFGVGSPLGESYPDQLQRLFNARTELKNVTVINGGVGSQNTAQLLDRLETNINNTKPDLIILQTGQPNWWNFYTYNSYLNRIAIDRKSFKEKFSPLYDFFAESRVCRLIFYLKIEIEESVVPSYRKEKEYRNSVRWIETGDKDFFADEQKVNKAINLFLKGVEIDPNYPDNYVYLYRIYFCRSNYDEALKWLMKTLTVNSAFGDSYKYLTYNFLRTGRDIPFIPDHEKIKKEIDKLMDEFKKTNTESSLILADSKIKSWAESDIIEMIRIIRSKNIKIVLQTYPYRIKSHGIPFGQEINDIIRDVAVRFKIPLVDQEKIFQETKDQGTGDNEGYFVADGHCNNRGYKLMAVNVYNKIVEAGILDMPHVKD